MRRTAWFAVGLVFCIAVWAWLAWSFIVAATRYAS